MRTSFLNLLILFVAFNSQAQHEDSLYQIFESDLSYLLYDSISVNNLLTGKSDSSSITLDSTCYGEKYKSDIEYIGSFNTKTGARYKLVRYITYTGGESLWDKRATGNRLIVFDGTNEMIGHYELLYSETLQIVLEDGELRISEHPKNYDCHISHIGITNLKTHFPIALTRSICQTNDEFDQEIVFGKIYFIATD